MIPETDKAISPTEQVAKRRRKLPIFLKIGGAAFCVIAASPAYHYQNTWDIIGAYAGKGVDCSGDTDNRSPYDAIVIPGAGIARDGDGFVPNEQGRLRYEAAAIAVVDGEAHLVIMLNGKPNPVEDETAPRQYFDKAVADLVTHGGKAPDYQIITESTSVDTATNMDQLVRIAKENNLHKFLIITNDFHADRSALLACAKDLAAKGVSAENIIIVRFPERASEVNLIRKRGFDENGIEKWEIFSQLWFTQGEAEVFFKQLVDK